MKTYRIYHRALKQFRQVTAASAQNACRQAGWLIGDCWVREFTPVVSNPNTASGHSGGGWRNVTSRNPGQHHPPCKKHGGIL